MAVAGAGLALPIVAVAQPTSTPAVAAVAGAGVRADFNGDGFSDLAVGIPLEDVGGVANAGAVQVLYGSAFGLGGAAGQLLTQDTGGVQGVAEANDQFGAAVVPGNFNGDAFTDLAIGVPFEDGSVVDEGGVHVLYGSNSGLTANADEFFTQNTPGILETSEAGDRFGSALAAADLGRSGQADLVVGVPAEDVAGAVDAGVVQTIYGTPNGLTAVGSQLLRRGAGGIGGAVGAGDGFGAVLTAADFGRGGQADLAVGLPDDDLPGVINAGSVHVIYGSAAGLAAPGNHQITQSTGGVADTPETQDHFGSALAAADLGRSGQADLAIGVPAEDHSARGNAGAVHVLYGTANGVSSAGASFLTQTTPGVNGVADAFDRFGDALVAADFGGSAKADLAIGVPFENSGATVDAGAVAVLYGGANGVTTVNDQLLSQDTAGVIDAAETGDRFGETLAAGNFGLSNEADLAVGVPFEDVAAVVDAGGVHVLYGSPAQVSTGPDLLLTQNSGGVPDVAETSDQFGSVLAAHKG
jgi:hypothetical protein